METKNKYYLPIKLSPDVTVTYESSPAHKQEWLRDAVDFLTPIGTEVLSALDGVVSFVKDDSDIGGDTEDFDQYGNFIEIRHANDEFSIYEHLQKGGSLVKVGDSVKAGQIIGYSGKTGWIGGLGPHIHFDVHKYWGEGLNDYNSLKINWTTPPPNKENLYL
ncbi:MAG TPA: M23 family metallopeptidase [Candidatus Moranbacteria bacterium]|nr:M23 family metallopeptidase [Candidatus Moranbacteria bacterium]